MKDQQAQDDPQAPEKTSRDTSADAGRDEAANREAPREIGGREGPDPTRYGDWEKAGRCIDF